MARSREKQRLRLQRQIAEQRRWIEEHGADRAGYMARYGDSGDGADAIYNADTAALRNLQQDLRELEEGAGQ